jgi:hypothetical protein
LNAPQIFNNVLFISPGPHCCSPQYIGGWRYPLLGSPGYSGVNNYRPLKSIWILDLHQNFLFPAGYNLNLDRPQEDSSGFRPVRPP